MWGLLGKVFIWVLDKLFPDRSHTEEAPHGTYEQALNDKLEGEAKRAQAATDAARAADALSVRDEGSIRAPDPHSRD